MASKTTRTFKTVLRSIRHEQGISMLDLGLKIDSDASHIHKIENGQDITLSTMLRLAEALGVQVQFGSFVLSQDPAIKRRTRRK